MNFLNNLLSELKQEAAVTRCFLALVPFEHSDYQPHPNSEKLARLAIHVAEIMAWWDSCLNTDGLDFEHFEPVKIENTTQLLTYFDKLQQKAVESIANSQHVDLQKKWSMSHGETIYFTLPKYQVLRVFCMNHLIHHRAQLGVYLRLLNIALPATYGPSADNYEVILTQPF
jgi:uncharacterized damage-inducible protein DinB